VQPEAVRTAMRRLGAPQRWPARPIAVRRVCAGAHPRSTIPPMSPPPPTTALLTLTPARGPRPLLIRALPWAEALHAALVKASDDGGNAGSPPCLTGRDVAGKPLSGHGHAFVLPLSLDPVDAAGPEPAIDHALVHARMGLDAAARRALASLERLWISPEGAALHVALAALGQREELAGRVAALRPAVAWRSTTPFVPPRHLKPRGANALAGQIQAELRARGLPAAVEVHAEMGPAAGGSRGPRSFLLQRSPGAKAPPVHVSADVRLRFAEPVAGPIALGYASHFGMGVLVPEDEPAA